MNQGQATLIGESAILPAETLPPEIRKSNSFQSLDDSGPTIDQRPRQDYPHYVSIEATYAQIRRALVARRRAVAEEIGRHPRPITGCDVHFNRMLEERASISQEIDRFDAFISASELLTPAAKERVLVSEENVVCP